MGLIQFVQNFQDLSTDRGYQFKFNCDKCGNGYMTEFRASVLGTRSAKDESGPATSFWNTLEIRTGSKLFGGIDDGSWLYFVHSYAPVPDDDSVVVATTDYGGPVVAAVEQGPLWATQFHPEKSAANGLRLLRNFAEACGQGPA